MKALSFAIPNTEDQLVRIQLDEVPYFYDEYHFHHELQITYFVRGYGKCIIGDQISQFKEGDLFVIGSNLPHVFKSDKDFYEKNHPNCYAQSIIINTDAFSRELLSKPEFDDLKQFISHSNYGLKYSISDKPNILNLFNKTIKSKGLQKIISSLSLIMKLNHHINSNSLNRIGYESKEGDNYVLNKVFQYSLNNYHKEITLDEIAHLANMSKTNFCRFFKKRTRKTFMVFLNEVRIQEACKLLRSSDANISEIAYQAGFNNLSNFNRQFKKVVLCSPNEYRKKHIIN